MKRFHFSGTNMNMEELMDRHMYKAAMAGSFEALQRRISSLYKGESDQQQRPVLSRTTHNGTNLLHIAANMGRAEFARELLAKCPELSAMQNFCGDTPLHLAARNGYLEVVKVIIRNCYFFPSAEFDTPVSSVSDGLEAGRKVGRVFSRDDRGDCQQILRLKNMKGNIPLQEALRSGHKKVAMYLWNSDTDPITTLRTVNVAGESTLYLAAQSGFPEVVKMVGTFKEDHHQEDALGGPEGRNPLHAATYSGNCECVELLVNSEGLRILDKPDNKGRTALHFAAETGSSKVASVLIHKDASLAYVRDVNGRTPLFEAASCGNLDVLEEILGHCPDTIEYRDDAGQNALHLIILTNAVHVLEEQRVHILYQLVNEPDGEGNTPLHTAAKHQKHKMLKRLLDVPWVDPSAKNQLGFTALDICETQWPSMKRIDLSKYLKNHHVTRGQIPRKWKLATDSEISKLDMPREDLKKMVETLSVVAVLLAGITFSAAFTIPGGYYSSDVDPNAAQTHQYHHIGSSILASKGSVQVFILADTLAVSCSLTSMFILIYSMLGSQAFMRKTIIYSKWLLYAALHGTLIAFMTGIYAVISENVMWEAIVVCVMGCSTPFLIKFLRKMLDIDLQSYLPFKLTPSSNR